MTNRGCIRPDLFGPRDDDFKVVGWECSTSFAVDAKTPLAYLRRIPSPKKVVPWSFKRGSS